MSEEESRKEVGMSAFTVGFLLGVIVGVFCFNEAHAQHLPFCTRNLFADDCGKNSEVPVTYTDELGQVKTENYTRRLGCVKDSTLCRFDDPARQILNLLFIPGVNGYGLLLEHWWACIHQENLHAQKTKELIGIYEFKQKILQKTGGSVSRKYKCLLSDPSCGGVIAATIKAFFDYWVSPFAFEATKWWELKPPSKEIIYEHFKICVLGSDNDVRTPDSGLPQQSAFLEWLQKIALPEINKDFDKYYEIRKRKRALVVTRK